LIRLIGCVLELLDLLGSRTFVEARSVDVDALLFCQRLQTGEREWERTAKEQRAAVRGSRCRQRWMEVVAEVSKATNLNESLCTARVVRIHDSTAWYYTHPAWMSLDLLR
jgi:hypothetical protein